MFHKLCIIYFIYQLFCYRYKQKSTSNNQFKMIAKFFHFFLFPFIEEMLTLSGVFWDSCKLLMWTETTCWGSLSLWSQVGVFMRPLLGHALLSCICEARAGTRVVIMYLWGPCRDTWRYHVFVRSVQGHVTLSCICIKLVKFNLHLW